jgi:hypothetical protein
VVATTTVGATTAEVTPTQATTATTAIPEDDLSVDKIKVEIERCLGVSKRRKKATNVRNPYPKANDEKLQTRSYLAPAQIVAFLGYLLSLVPSKT